MKESLLSGSWINEKNTVYVGAGLTKIILSVYTVEVGLMKKRL